MMTDSESESDQRCEHRSEEEESPVQKKARRGSLSSISETEANEIVGADVNDIILSEQHDISKIFEFGNLEVPNKLLQSIFKMLSEHLLSFYPSEMVLETRKRYLFKNILTKLIVHFRAKYKSTLNQLIVQDEQCLCIDNVSGKFDYAIIEESKGSADRYLVVVEMKTGSPRDGMKQLLLYLKRVQQLNPGLKEYYGLTSNVEYYQLVVLSGDQFKASTPRPLLYPKMTDPNEMNFWISSKYSEMILVLYSILEKALSQPSPAFNLTTESLDDPDHQFTIPEIPPENVTKAAEARIQLEKSIGVKLKDVISNEYHQVGAMFKFDPKTPPELLRTVFARLSKMVGRQEYPNELVGEHSKWTFVTTLLGESIDFIRPKFNLTDPKHCLIEADVFLRPHGVKKDKTDKKDKKDTNFAITQTLDGHQKKFICVIEASRDLPRCAVLKCMASLKRMQELDPGAEEIFGLATNAEYWQLISLSKGGHFKCSTPMALLFPLMWNPDEEDYWTAHYSDVVKIIYSILNAKLTANKQIISPNENLLVDSSTAT